MKRLFLIRHAKAEQHYEGIDYNRKLTPQGLVNIESLALSLHSNFPPPQYILSSAAKRTVQTTKNLIKVWHNDSTIIEYKAEIYEDLNIQKLHHLLTKVDNSIMSIAIVGHNPWISYIGSQLSSSWDLPLPTSSCLVLEFPINNWAEIEPRSAIEPFRFFNK